MNKDQDYPSDSDQSDEDFCPNNASDSDISSNEESDYKGSDSDLEQNEIKKSKKKNVKKKKSKSKIEKVNSQSDNEEEIINRSDPISEIEEKKRSDDLWANFLSDVNDTTNSGNTSDTISNKKNDQIKNTNNDKNEVIKFNNDKVEKVKVIEILEFAGEEIEVTKEVIKDDEKRENPLKITKQNTNIINKFSKVPLKRPAGGIGSILGQIGKKTKISVLEKSKLDWEGFKNKEGLKEELKTFNKGKNGFLEKQDFLQRTDLRQFEIEKGMRTTTKRKF